MLGAEEDEPTVTFITDNETRIISFRPDDTIHNAIATEFGHPVNKIEKVVFGDNAVQPGESFKQWGIEHRAKLTVHFRPKVPFNEVVQDIVELNPNIQSFDLDERVQVDPEDDSRVVGNLNWNHNIKVLPESIGGLTVVGDLNLSTEATTLPESFCYLAVSGNLSLKYKLTTLPESFGNLAVGGDLDLFYNELTTLPENFGRLTIGGSLYLSRNKLTTLPESFGNLTVGGNLTLIRNKLTTLPESFGRLTVTGDLDLRDNNLTTLPKSFGSLKVGGTVYLGENPLEFEPQFDGLNVDYTQKIPWGY